MISPCVFDILRSRIGAVMRLGLKWLIRMLIGALALNQAVIAVAREAVVTDVRISGSGTQTRIVLNLSDSVQVEPFLLADPKRLVLNLPETVWKLPKNWARAKGGAISAFRFGKLGPGRSRMVFDLTGPVKVLETVTLPPQGERRYRLVIDLGPSDETTFRKSAGWPAGEIAPPSGNDLAVDPKRPQRDKKLICIDPGHGGIDPGASGVSGTLEKDIVLTTSILLRDMLQRSGRYQVAMTRDTDIFLSLKARVAFCRGKAADLMISVHADSASVAVRGATVYTLSEKASDVEAEQLARSENQSDVIAGVEIGREDDLVSSILIDLAQRDTKLKSVNFARALVPELNKTGRTVPRSHKFAGFRVLKAPDVPSVLLEMGYLTNAADEVQLQSAAWRATLVQAVVRALDAHFSEVARTRGQP
jgi:N-acetylmuramoyl-L-alanine amidase